MPDNLLIFERSHPGRRCAAIPKCDLADLGLNSSDIAVSECFSRKSKLNLPEVSENELVRHYTNLSRKAFGVDNGFYPLGSCTMKYNPKLNEDIASMPAFTDIHPLQPEHTVQGTLEVLGVLEQHLCEITGMDNITLQPAAGAHGELTALMMMKNYFESIGQTDRTVILVPDSAHGTNPASAAMAGFSVVTVPSWEDGSVDLDKLRELSNETTAGIMLTNPNTVGCFDPNIKEIAQIVHDAGGLLYYDGANLNPILGITRPGDMGFDVVHLNLHKTFGTPHGGGGPGSGPTGCKAFLAEFMPNPYIVPGNNGYKFTEQAKSIGKIHSFYGNFLVCLKAYAYILTLGREGIREVGEVAVLNANYMLHHLKDYYTAPYPEPCMHEFVLSLEKLKKETGVSAADVSKALIDAGMHPPTMYFPLIVPEALMVEPTETETKETLDKCIEILINLHKQAYESPETLQAAPITTPVKRLDEVRAARSPIVKFNCEN